MDYSKIKGATFVRFKKNDFLIRSGEIADSFFVVVSGQCYRMRFEENGIDSIQATYSKGHIVGAVLAYREIIAKSDIVAGNTLCCWKIPRQNFIDALDTSPELNKELLTQLMDEYLQLSTHYFKRKNGETPVMLCDLLLSRSIPKEDGYFYLPKIYNNVRIAAYLGVHKVTATRIINVLQKEHVVTRTKDGLQITNPEQLKRYASNQQKLIYKYK